MSGKLRITNLTSTHSTNEMISHIYVLTSIIEDEILTECYSLLAIHLE
jgi:hypothetical protein